MSEHTPGPWHVEQQREDDGVHVLICSAPGAEPGYPRESFMVAESTFETSPRGIANANLIAAAPDLLAALEAVSDDAHEEHAKGWTDVPMNCQHEKCVMVRAAIAKATGQPA